MRHVPLMVIAALLNGPLYGTVWKGEELRS